ncbi:hypothetical protein MPTK2_3g09990 [Marchantia polymorpha subsp. ruderalis]
MSLEKGATMSSNSHVHRIGEDKKGLDWEALSEDVHIMVLRKLPVFSLIRVRGVCKRWNHLIRSHEMWAPQHPGPRAVPIYFSHGQLIVFDHRKNCWEEQSLDYVKFPSHSLSLLDSAGGLLCFKTSATGELIVCNPISMECQYLRLPQGFSVEAITDPLPNLLKPVVTLEGGKEAIEAFQRSFGKEVVVGLVTERHKQWYKLVVAGIRSEESTAAAAAAAAERATLVYDSFTERWSTGAEVPKGARFWESGKTVNVDGSLYCLTFTAGLASGTCGLDWPWSIVRYNSDADVWSEIRLGRRGSILPQLVEHRGRILVVQRNGKSQNEISISELKEDEPMCALTTRHLPSCLFPPKPGKRCPMIMQDWCVGQGDWLYVAGRHRESQADAAAGPRGLVILAHSFSEDVWIRLPTMADAPTLRGHFSAALHGFHNATWLHAFEPSLGARV